MFLRPEYRQIVESRLRRFVRNADDVMCVGVFTLQDQQCKVCDYHPITWNYIIENLATHERLIAGSECICNYEVILKEWGYQPEYIVYPTYFLRYARWITEGSEHQEGNPLAIRFHDDFLDRATVDARQVIQEVSTGANLLAHVPEKKPAKKATEVRVEVSISCPRCANGGKHYCDLCAGRGIRVDRYQAHRLCPLCRAVALCEGCDDLEDKAHFRPRKQPVRVSLPKDVLEGKAPLRTFGELAALMSARDKTKKAPPRQQPSEGDDIP
jgi:hypothetical protein